LLSSPAAARRDDVTSGLERDNVILDLQSTSKQALREAALARRLSMPLPERERAALALRDNFLKSVPLLAGVSVSAYMPIRSEIDPLPLCDALLAAGHRVLMPRVLPQSGVLEFRTWTRATPMITSGFGIEEPDPAKSEAFLPDLFILPLLGFDARGHRLGYGAGYYDQTLARLKGAARAIGVAYEWQLCGEIPAEPHDRPLDLCVTEQKVHSFGGRA
jgi:5-formyltetrahydrofolate cyclo-ligase